MGQNQNWPHYFWRPRCDLLFLPQSLQFWDSEDVQPFTPEVPVSSGWLALPRPQAGSASNSERGKVWKDTNKDSAINRIFNPKLSGIDMPCEHGLLCLCYADGILVYIVFTGSENLR